MIQYARKCILYGFPCEMDSWWDLENRGEKNPSHMKTIQNTFSCILKIMKTMWDGFISKQYCSLHHALYLLIWVWGSARMRLVIQKNKLKNVLVVRSAIWHTIRWRNVEIWGVLGAIQSLFWIYNKLFNLHNKNLHILHILGIIISGDANKYTQTSLYRAHQFITDCVKYIKSRHHVLTSTHRPCIN